METTGGIAIFSSMKDPHNHVVRSTKQPRNALSPPFNAFPHTWETENRFPSRSYVLNDLRFRRMFE